MLIYMRILYVELEETFKTIQIVGYLCNHAVAVGLRFPQPWLDTDHISLTDQSAVSHLNWRSYTEL